MFKFNRTPVLARNVVALIAMSGAGVAMMGAQAPAAQSQTTSTVDLRVPAMDTSSLSLFSSSSDEEAPATVASLHPTVPNLGEAMQYGGGQRKRYGRPRYRGANTNADGSSKYIFFGGVGLVQPIGNTFSYLTPSYGIQVGGGRQFNRHFAVPIEFNYDHFGFTKKNISDESYIYTGDANAADNGIDANSHIWSFSVTPTYTVYSGDGFGAYLLGSAGFYHKVGNLTAPQDEEACYGYICEDVEVQGNFATYTSNAPGFAGGFGLTYKFSHFSGERFYAEARYVFIDNSQRYGYTAADAEAGTIPVTATNFYPANSNRTTYIPIKVGLRF
jgi:hypothetical protein